MTDLEIAHNITLKDINIIASKLNLTSDDIEMYGKYKAKIVKEKGKKNGKVILVTAINPTKYGEGKTTVSIGLGDAFNKLNKSILLALREPSLGPVFGVKGGATGGGYSQVVPMEDINLHFTGDFHAITAANNLISAAIYNHIEQGNSLDIKKVSFSRCLDVNDRSLRNVKLECNGEEYLDHFNITAASEVMALFCLSTDIDDLKDKLSKIIVGFNSKDEPIYVHDLNLEGALTVLLEKAFKPNLVQTLEGTPAIIHGGPFANIATGCSSITSINLAKSLADYVITEAGFGSDLGAEKFLNIVCPKAAIKPSCIVLVVTVRALKYNGDGLLEKGTCNIDAHLNHLKNYNVPIVVCLNKFSDDSSDDINYIKDYVNKLGYPLEVSEAYVEGGEGAINLAEAVIKASDEENSFEPLVNDKMTIKEKLIKLGATIYNTNSLKITYSDIALEKLKLIDKLGLSYLPICVAKTQYSISDDATKLGYPKDNSLYVRDIIINRGAGFITLICGKIFTMPGLPKHPNYENIDLVNNEIKGLF